MAYVNGTTHYNLPQTVGTDKRDWADTNQAFADIDAALYGAVDDVAQAQTEIDALTGRMNTAEQNIATNTGNIAGLDTRLTTAEGAITSQQSQITDLRQDTEDMICAYNEASATSTHAYEIGDYFIYNDVLYKATQAIAIGDTIVPDTNCATTNVTTEILALIGSIGTKVLATIHGDGTTTYSAIIDQLFSLCTASTNKNLCLIYYRGGESRNYIMQLEGYDGNRYAFHGAYYFASSSTLTAWEHYAECKNTASNLWRWTHNLSDSGTVSDITGTASNLNDVFTLIVSP